MLGSPTGRYNLVKAPVFIQARIPMGDTSIIEIDLVALDRNLRQLRGLVGPSCAICPVLKADAYGFGVVRIARRLERMGCECMAVFAPSEAALLLDSGIRTPILVMKPVHDLTELKNCKPWLRSGRVHLTLHDRDQLDRLAGSRVAFDQSLPVHLEIDTGMSRGGCGPEQAGALLEMVAKSRQFRLAGIFTHFACADFDPDFTRRQMDTFERFLHEHRIAINPDCVIHAANSYATLRDTRYHRSMVRVGLAWAGYGKEWMTGPVGGHQDVELMPILRWTSEITLIKTIEKGATVGYGATWTASRPTVLGIIPVGYADGYPVRPDRIASGMTVASVGVMVDSVALNKPAYAPVVGAVSMDMITLDLTDVVREFGHHEVKPGTMVELISNDPHAPNHLPALAKIAGLIPHEVLCGLNPRIRRVHGDASVGVETCETKPTATSDVT